MHCRIQNEGRSIMTITTLKRAIIFGAAFLGTAHLMSTQALATTTNAVTITGGSMFAGPGADYRAFSRLAAGLDVTVHGCLVQWNWCDVTWRGNRGWVRAVTLEYRGTSERLLPIASDLQQAGVPIVAFDLQAYWIENYSKRYWFSDNVR